MRDSQIYPIGYDPHPPTSLPQRPTPSREVMPQCDCSDAQYEQQLLHPRLPPAPSLTLGADSAYHHVASHSLKYEVQEW